MNIVELKTPSNERLPLEQAPGKSYLVARTTLNLPSTPKGWLDAKAADWRLDAITLGGVPVTAWKAVDFSTRTNGAETPVSDFRALADERRVPAKGGKAKPHTLGFTAHIALSVDGAQFRAHLNAMIVRRGAGLDGSPNGSIWLTCYLVPVAHERKSAHKAQAKAAPVAQVKAAPKSRKPERLDVQAYAAQVHAQGVPAPKPAPKARKAKPAAAPQAVDPAVIAKIAAEAAQAAVAAYMATLAR